MFLFEASRSAKRGTLTTYEDADAAQTMDRVTDNRIGLLASSAPVARTLSQP